jgi:hypothetical protein
MASNGGRFVLFTPSARFHSVHRHAALSGNSNGGHSNGGRGRGGRNNSRGSDKAAVAAAPAVAAVSADGTPPRQQWVRSEPQDPPPAATVPAPVATSAGKGPPGFTPVFTPVDGAARIVAEVLGANKPLPELMAPLVTANPSVSHVPPRSWGSS